VNARASKRLLAALDTDNTPAADTRPIEFERLVNVSADLAGTVREVFAGTALPENDAMVRAVVETRHEVEHAWNQARSSFIIIGRALNRLNATMRTRSERVALKANFERLFPLSEPIASQFRRVADAIDSGLLSEDQCPASYSAAYQLTLLEPDELNAARGQGLVAPTTSRSALIAFRREIAMSSEVRVDVTGLMAERRRIDARLVQLQKEIQDLGARRDEIARVLGKDEAA